MILGNYVWTCAPSNGIKPRRSRVISLIPLGLWQLYTELAVVLINGRILNVRKLSELLRLGSNLFRLETVDGIKGFSKKLCFPHVWSAFNRN